MVSEAQLLLSYYLKQLKLPAFLRDYESTAEQCCKNRADYPAYLLALAERETLEREQRAGERRIRAANFPSLKRLSKICA